MPVVVGSTEVGRGLFAAREFQQEEQIARVLGEVVSDEDYSSDTCVDMRDGSVLEPDVPFRFLNHSCEPNCEFIVWELEDHSTELWLHALRNILPGDELTIDYSWDAESAIPCCCRSELCRGWIVAEDQLASLPRVRHPKQGQAC